MLSRFFSKDECETYYRFGRTLGQGSFATVKLATNKKDGTKWAVKIIKKTSLGEDDEEALQTEVDILRSLDHSNIVNLREVFDCTNNFYMIMEICSGGELFDRIVEKESYTEAEARKAVFAVADALKFCHERNIVHRDLKPENLLYADETDDATLKLADFGLAKLLDENSLLHTACGTPGYVAPEILEGRAYDQQVDMWSLGVITYILLCGFPPFYNDSNPALFRQIKSGRYDYPSPYWDEVSDDAKDLIDNLLVLNPSERFTADDVINHIWIRETAQSATGTLSHFNASMRAYNARRKFRAGIMLVQAMNALGRISHVTPSTSSENKES